MMLPLIFEIPYVNPCHLFENFSQLSGAILLDSAEQREGCGRYSFIGIDPFIILQSKNGLIYKNNLKLSGDPFTILQMELSQYRLSMHAGLPPFQGGVAGYFSYELYQHLEKIPFAKLDDMHFPDMLLGFYDLIIGFDTLTNKAWIYSSGFPELDENKRIKRAQQRLDWLLTKVNNASLNDTLSNITCETTAISSNFTAENYCLAVSKVINYILDGDIFETNISQRYTATMPHGLSTFDLYARLRKINPAPFAAFLNFENTILASASPERFIKLENGLIETRPIKGTRKRSSNLREDADLAQALLNSPKDHAENTMIVDLMRNDLSRVCEDFSVQVPKLCGLESYATVHHLVSIVHGKLKNNYDAIDLLRASFPGGSITGAPKIRAMEIIAEVEPTQRGPYCGSIGYIGFNGNMDTSITIRTYCIQDNKITFQVGGAIVADSLPEDEYFETLAKAAALNRALTMSI